jgi:hypothetical protein
LRMNHTSGIKQALGPVEDNPKQDLITART